MAAGRLGLDLARQGALVVSGMAQGVDAAALRGALRGGGRVVSVLGSGIDVIYPAGHGDLYEDVAAAGTLLSEYPRAPRPPAPIFLCVTASIAGLSLGCWWWRSQTSGALITARWALEQGRDVFCVPGGSTPP
ncbi:MAG: DNA-processing protein DprA [Oscillospiraceae bacterium]